MKAGKKDIYEVLSNLENSYFKELYQTNEKEVVDFSKKIRVPPEIPSQENTWDCGVFLLMFVKYLAMKQKVDFDTESMKSFRGEIKKELECGAINLTEEKDLQWRARWISVEGEKHLKFAERLDGSRTKFYKCLGSGIGCQEIGTKRKLEVTNNGANLNTFHIHIQEKHNLKMPSIKDDNADFFAKKSYQCQYCQKILSRKQTYEDHEKVCKDKVVKEQMPPKKRPAQNNLQDNLMEGDSQTEDVPQDLKRAKTERNFEPSSTLVEQQVASNSSPLITASRKISAGKKIHGKKAPPRGKEPKFRKSSETEKEESICVSPESEDEDTQENSVAMDSKLNEDSLVICPTPSSPKPSTSAITNEDMTEALKTSTQQLPVNDRAGPSSQNIYLPDTSKLHSSNDLAITPDSRSIPNNLETMTIKQLKEELRNMKLPTKGDKSTLIKRLSENQKLATQLPPDTDSGLPSTVSDSNEEFVSNGNQAFQSHPHTRSKSEEENAKLLLNLSSPQQARDQEVCDIMTEIPRKKDRDDDILPRDSRQLYKSSSGMESSASPVNLFSTLSPAMLNTPQLEYHILVGIQMPDSSVSHNSRSIYSTSVPATSNMQGLTEDSGVTDMDHNIVTDNINSNIVTYNTNDSTTSDGNIVTLNLSDMSVVDKYDSVLLGEYRRISTGCYKQVEGYSYLYLTSTGWYCSGYKGREDGYNVMFSNPSTSAYPPCNGWQYNSEYFITAVWCPYPSLVLSYGGVGCSTSVTIQGAGCVDGEYTQVGYNRGRYQYRQAGYTLELRWYYGYCWIVYDSSRVLLRSKYPTVCPASIQAGWEGKKGCLWKVMDYSNSERGKSVLKYVTINCNNHAQ